jgi:hypothetical protein
MATKQALVLALSLFAATALSCSPAAEGPKEKEQPKNHLGKFTIGKETTYVTGPLDKDGYVDYAAALDERLSKGVTPANNANVLLWKALGPHPGGSTRAAEFLKLLGIEPLPEKGDYFIDLARYMKEQLKIEPADEDEPIREQLGRAMDWPWTAKDYPNLASWLKANAKPLAVAIEATKRSHYFSPMVVPKSDKGPSPLIGALMPGVFACREIANALAARAMLRVSQGAVDDAWQDLLACHRLGRLVGRGATLFDASAGFAIDGIALRTELAFLERTKLDAKQIEKCLRDLQKLPPLPTVADKLDLGERFQFLDSLMFIDRYGIDYLESLSSTKGPKPASPLSDEEIKKWRVEIVVGIDWDRALRNSNRWFDRLVAASREKDRGSRETKLDQIDADLKALRANLKESGGTARLFLGDEIERGEIIGEMLTVLMLPATRKLWSGADRAQQIQDNVILAFALAWYQRDHGRYPEELKALMPKYLERIPSDLFSGKPLVYRPKENGYLLYSVGVNGKDEGGRGYDDDPPGDDLSVRMPLPEPRAK